MSTTPLPTQVVYPTLTLTNVNNLSVDNSTQTLAGLADNTTYNLRAVLRHNATGESIVIDRVLDDTGNVVEFTTQLNEVIYLAAGGVQAAHTTIGFELRDFNSNKNVNYDVEYFIYEYDQPSATYTKLAQTHTTTDVSNAAFTPPVATYPSVLFDNLTSNTKYKITAKVLNKSTGTYYNGGTEIVLIDNQFTLEYIIDYNINTAITDVGVNSIILHFTRLGDNTGDASGLFNSILFRGSYEISPFNFATVDVTRTNVNFFDGGTNYTVTFTGLQPDTNYSFNGLFTRNTLYTNKPANFGYNVTTDAYAVSYTLGTLNISDTSFTFRLNNLTDNSGGTANFTYIHFLVFDAIDGSQVGGIREYLDIPHLTTRQFVLDGLSPDTEYRVQAIFHKVGLYTITINNLFTDTTISAAPAFDASIILDDQNISTTASSVQFTIVDFQSPHFDNTEVHTVTLQAITPNQAVALADNSVLHWNFADETLVDYFGNEFSTTSAYTYDGTGLVTQQANLRLQFTPTDWGIFDDLKNNWRNKVVMTIPSSATADKYLSTFVNATHNKGFRIHIYNNNIQFQGYVRLDDGNAAELFFYAIYDGSQLTGGFFDVEHEYEFIYEGITLGSDPSNADLYGRAKIVIDGVEVASVDLDNTSGVYTPATKAEGVFIANSGYYEVQMPISGTKLNEYTIGTSRTSP